MARRVFFHIGAPKSGTTFLQTVMWENRAAVADRGLLFPGGRRFDQYLLYDHIRRPASGNPRSAQTWRRVLRQIAKWDGDVLITHEFLGSVDADQASWAIEQMRPADVEVVFTARDYVRAFPGIWLEGLKMGAERSFDDFVEGSLRGESGGAWSWLTQDAPAILERWSRTLEPDRIHIVTVPPAGAPRDLLWNRWCAALGIEPSAVDLGVALPNESLGVRQAALLHRVQQELTAPMLKKPEAYRWFRSYFAQEVLAEQESERFGLRPAQAAGFAELSQRAAKVIECAGYRVHGDLDDLRPVPDGRVMRTPDEVTSAELVDVAAVTIDRLLHDVRALTMERDAQRSEARLAAKVSAHPGAKTKPARRAAGAAVRRARGLMARIRRVVTRDRG